MFAREKLYDAAFHYKKTGIWKRLWDSDLFAVKLDYGEIGYISIMGKNGEYCALGLYIGEKGFQSYIRMMNATDDNFDSPFKHHEFLMQQECLQMELGNKDDLHPEELAELRAYTKKNGIRLSGKNACPHFIKYEPYYHPWSVSTEKDLQALYTALEASVLLAQILEEKSPFDVGIKTTGAGTGTIPVFEIKDGKLEKTGQVPLPKEQEEKNDFPTAKNEKAIETLKNLPKKGIFETELIMMLEAARNDPEETPYYPMMLLSADKDTQALIPIPCLVKWNEDSRSKSQEELIDAFADTLIQHEIRPKEVRCRDERTFALLNDLCEKSGIKVSQYTGKMDALDNAEHSFAEQFAPDEDGDSNQDIEDILNSILQMDDEELKLIPKPILNSINNLINSGMLPEPLESMLKKKLNNRSS